MIDEPKTPQEPEADGSACSALVGLSFIKSVLGEVAKSIAKKIVTHYLEELAHPKRPKRTPRKLKKAARKALDSMKNQAAQRQVQRPRQGSAATTG